MNEVSIEFRIKKSLYISRKYASHMKTHKPVTILILDFLHGFKTYDQNQYVLFKVYMWIMKICLKHFVLLIKVEVSGLDIHRK